MKYIKIDVNGHMARILDCGYVNEYYNYNKGSHRVLMRKCALLALGFKIAA